MQLSPDKMFGLLVGEVRARRGLVIAAFAVISLAALAAAILLPKSYQTNTLIHIEQQDILGTLLEGQAGLTSATNRSRHFREVIFSHRVLSQILEHGGWNKIPETPVERERMMKQIERQTEVTPRGNDLLEIAFVDTDRNRSFRVTQMFADLFIAESLEAKRQESQDAFDFIDKQVKEYHQKLLASEQRLKEYRTNNIDARPGTEVVVTDRIAQLRDRIERTNLALREARIREKSLIDQLAGETQSLDAPYESPIMQQIEELQSRLDRLRLDYHETYPEIVRLKFQIGELKSALESEGERRAAARDAAQARGETFVDEGLRKNPLYEQLRENLSRSRTEIAQLRTRLRSNEALLGQELEVAKRIPSVEAQLAELTRDYEVNQNVYRDLLRRRESAKLSLNADIERQGLSFTIQDPPQLPVTPIGFRFHHFALAGLLLGIGLPLALLYAMIQVDPRVRHESLLVEQLNLPVLASVPEVLTPDETRSRRVTTLMLTLVVAIVIATYGFFGWLRVSQIF